MAKPTKQNAEASEHPGLTALRNILKRKRWDEQGGYVGYRGNGKWDFALSGINGITPDEMNALFALAGIEPDVIVPLGECKDCKHSRNGKERGYEKPCVSCSRPYHSHFEPLKLERSKK